MADGVNVTLKKKHRKVLRSSFTKAANELDSHLKVGEPVSCDIEILWECLKSKFEELRNCDNEVYERSLEDATEEELIAEMESCEAYVRRFTELRLRCTKIIEPKPVIVEDQASVASGMTIASSSNKGVVSSDKRKFKLPQIEFKHYNGNIRDWLPFWSQFKKIHEDPDIDEGDKIEYLLQATVVGSRARLLVESFPARAENYKEIIDCMHARFGREDLQIEVYVRELLKLVLSNALNTKKLDMYLLYDQIETQLRALNTLGITVDKYAAMLFPLIESCLLQDILRTWQRSSFGLFNFGSNQSVNGNVTSLEVRLKNLMSFLQSEVENEQRINIASEGFGLASNFSHLNLKCSDEPNKKKHLKHSSLVPATAADLLNAETDKSMIRCIFCMGSHGSDVCFKAQKMGFNERRNIVVEKRVCFRCLKPGHQSRKCRSRLRCVVCGESHVPIMCRSLAAQKRLPDNTDIQAVQDEAKDQILTNQTGTHVFLQTLRVTLKGVKGSRVVRALVDTGSQRSYILKSTVLALDLKPKRAEKIVHCLFGGTESTNHHYCYDVDIVSGNYKYTIEVLDQPYICSEVSPVFYGPWMQELHSLSINISDSQCSGPIELLLGADVAQILYTGRRKMLQCGLVAVETYVGWTVVGKISEPMQKSCATMTVVSLFVNPSISELWELDVLGIEDPVEKKSKKEMALAAKELFIETISLDPEERYEVRLPWLSDHPPLPNNYGLAKKRLKTALQRLEKDDLFDRYDKVFKEWESLNIIEKVEERSSNGHFLPHRPVLKEGSTTDVRPVFDASAHGKNEPSLNQCLEKGPNLIELIPTLLLRFREFKIGVTSDIKKAFLQISVNEKDREFLKFLWFDKNGQEIVYRHRRVVFGVNCSPFLLGATLEYHLNKSLENCKLVGSSYSSETVKKLISSYYVDNCVTSVSDQHSLNKFIREAIVVMAEGQFELRGWEFSHNSDSDDFNISILGLKWFPKQDVLTVSPDIFEADSVDVMVTKRRLLSVAQKVFDPIGFTAPATLVPKLLLQKLWEKQISWDAQVDDEIATSFRKWVTQLPYLLEIKIPRWIFIGVNNGQTLSLHTFCDACQSAYAAVIFGRIVHNDEVNVYLLAAKSRVAPLKKLTIPRLELMAATIGARLYTQVKESLDSAFECYFWSDSSTVISWIQRNEEWGTFVWNRVSEIRRLTPAAQWRHVPGIHNPGDLPSRGCSPKELLKSKWWEGPRWLNENIEDWPTEGIVIDEEEITKEKKKKLVSALVNTECEDFWHLFYFSKFTKTIRMMSWILRFIYNIRSPANKKKGDCTVEELNQAERFILKQIQEESFPDLTDKNISCLNPFYDDTGIIRLKSRVSNRKDTEGFRFPILLPAKHPTVRSLIMETHKKLCHVGTQSLLCQLWENYWILGGRRAIRSVLLKCVTCRRHDSKPVTVETPPLPLDRVRDAAAFEICGVDFAGPLYLRTGEKVWICLFTCAVYRAIHLELSLSLSTSSFLQALRRFVARRGRPKTLYSDNGTNFRGAENAFDMLDWNQIVTETNTQRIIWRFNPPSASWWGGFFERLIGLVKKHLRRVLGRACLPYEELYTVICDCEAIINARPLTYMSNDPNDLIVLTPAMFLRDQTDANLPECDAIEKASLSRSTRNKQKLREDLRCRFRIEYLGQLRQLCERSPNVDIKLGNVVLVGSDNTKRIDWPVGRVVELIPGKDGHVRLVRVKTRYGELLRPVQRLFPLECSCDDEEEPFQSVCQPETLDYNKTDSATVEKDIAPGNKLKITRSGRVSKIPKRFL